jgi:hypothetical protein
MTTRMPSDVVPSDVVLDVTPEEQAAYARDAYRDYLRWWNERVRALEDARRLGDVERARRLAEELRQVWPPPSEVAEAAWVPARDRERPLASEGSA